MVEYYDGYDVVRAVSGPADGQGIDALTKQVNLKIADGWRPFGGLTAVSLYPKQHGWEPSTGPQILFYQPMVLRTAGEGKSDG